MAKQPPDASNNIELYPEWGAKKRYRCDDAVEAILRQNTRTGQPEHVVSGQSAGEWRRVLNRPIRLHRCIIVADMGSGKLPLDENPLLIISCDINIQSWGKFWVAEILDRRHTDAWSVTKESLSKALAERLKGLQQCIVVDTSGGCGSAFELYLVTKEFDGVSLLERHRMVQNLLKEEIKQIHALSMKTWTPEQWSKKNKSCLRNCLTKSSHEPFGARFEVATTRY